MDSRSVILRAHLGNPLAVPRGWLIVCLIVLTWLLATGLGLGVVAVVALALGVLS